MGMAQQTASGQGPSAAADLLAAQTAKTQANANALASSGSGSQGQGEARRNAMMLGANATQDLGAQAAAARSKEQLGGESLYGQLAGESRAQDIQNAQLGLQSQLGVANIGLQQQSLNQQASEFNSAQNQQMLSSMAGLAGGAMLAFADGDMGGPPGAGASPNGDFKEPGGPAHWTLREEKDYILAVNQRTGQMYKLATQPLSPEEQKQAMAPHGAGPLGANDPRRQSKPMADGDLGSRGAQGPIPGPSPRTSFADVVRMAHSGLYNDSGLDPMGGGGMYRSDENEPRTRQAASAGGIAVGRIPNKAGQHLYNDADVGPGQTSLLGPNAPTTSVNMAGNPSPYYSPDDSGDVGAGLKMPSSNDVYYSQPGTDREGDWDKATQMATDAGNGKVQNAPTYFDNPELQNSLRSQVQGGSSSQSDGKPAGGGNKFFKALGGALQGYSKAGSIQAPEIPTIYPSYMDGDLNAQLDQAHKAEMTMDDVTVAPGQGDDEGSPVTKSSPVEGQTKRGAHDEFPDPYRAFQVQAKPSTRGAVTDFAATSSIPDPYAKLPQGLESDDPDKPGAESFYRGMGDFPKFEQRSEGIHWLPNEENATVETSSRSGGGDIKSKYVPDQSPPVDWSQVPDALAKHWDRTTYMDGDMGGDPFLASSNPDRDGKEVTYGRSARNAFDADIAALRKRLDAEDEAAKRGSKHRGLASANDLPPNPYNDGDLSDNDSYTQGARDGVREFFNRANMGKSLSGPIDMGNGEIFSPQPSGQWDYQPKPSTPPDEKPRVASSVMMHQKKFHDGDLTSKFAGRSSKKRKRVSAQR